MSLLPLLAFVAALVALPAASASAATTASTATATATATATNAKSAAITTSTLTLIVPATVDVTRHVPIKGTLKLGGGVVIPANTTVTITRTGPSGTTGSTKIGTATVASGASIGAFSLADPTLPAYGNYTYTAAYSGTSTIAPATATQKTTITRFETSLTLAASTANDAFDGKVTLTAHLGTTYTGRYVTLYAQAFGDTGRRVIVSAKVNAKGDLTGSYSPETSTTFIAYFGGDAHYAPKTAARITYVYVHVSEQQSGYYNSALAGSTLYRLYRSNAALKATIAVVPNKRGECVEFHLQEYFDGGWRDNQDTGCFTLNSSSKTSATFTLGQADIGYHYRIRTAYVRGSDTENLDNDSGWQYFIVES